MKFIPYFIGFGLGFATASLIWIGIITTPINDFSHNAKIFCEKQGFVSYKVDKNQNVFCSND